MSLPYENATSGDKAIGDMQKILRTFGCQKFGYMIDDGEGSLLVQFEYRGRQVSVKASMSGYAASWLKEHPYSNRMRKTAKQHEAEAMEVASVAVFSILRDWIKGQVMAIEDRLTKCTWNELTSAVDTTRIEIEFERLGLKESA